MADDGSSLAFLVAETSLQMLKKLAASVRNVKDRAADPAIGLHTGHLRRMHLLYCEACTCATRTPSCVPQTPACLPQLCGFFPHIYIYLSSTCTSLFWAMNTCVDEACAVALALKARRPDKDEPRRLGGGKVELVRNCAQYYQASNLDGKPHEKFWLGLQTAFCASDAIWRGSSLTRTQPCCHLRCQQLLSARLLCIRTGMYLFGSWRMLPNFFLRPKSFTRRTGIGWDLCSGKAWQF